MTLVFLYTWIDCNFVLHVDAMKLKARKKFYLMVRCNSSQLGLMINV